jgi:hypothetical protein
MSEKPSYPQQAKSDPKAAILVMFTELEGLLNRSYARNYPNEPKPRSVSILIKNLSDKRVIDSSLRDDLDDLRRRRNEIAHTDPNIGEEVALDYYSSLSVVLVELHRTSLFQ